MPPRPDARASSATFPAAVARSLRFEPAAADPEKTNATAIRLLETSPEPEVLAEIQHYRLNRTSAAMFERLVPLRMVEEKVDEAAAVAGVISDNLFGLEIDPRCTQIGAFNLALAAWRRGRVLVTHNGKGFPDHHEAWQTWPPVWGMTAPSHPGIIVLAQVGIEDLAAAVVAFFDAGHARSREARTASANGPVGSVGVAAAARRVATCGQLARTGSSAFGGHAACAVRIGVVIVCRPREPNGLF